jgi:hypothetical protein
MVTTGNNCIGAAAESRFPGLWSAKRHGRLKVLGLILTDGSLLFYLGHPTCNFTGEQWLVRELP